MKRMPHVMKLRVLLGLLGLLAWPAVAQAEAQVRPFVSGSLAAIRTAHAGQPFILSLWSIDCSHCPKELAALGALKKAHPRLRLVLVATDNGVPPTALAEYVAQHGLEAAEQWVFAGEQDERLRHEIDPRWWGELPRTYFFDAAQRMEGVSGLVPLQRLQQWATAAGR